MSNNSHYFSQKDIRKEKAVLHTEEMERKHTDEIQECINNTKIYSFTVPEYRRGRKHSVLTEVTDEDAVSAIFNHHDGKTAVLNFASFYNPGGKFIEGSSAQEESLCHESFLYNVLRQFDEYYSWNQAHKNKGLYVDRALYSPGVLFIKDGKSCRCDVITCAAPNISVGHRYGTVSSEENSAALRQRAEFVKEIAEENEVKTLILGSWGCGVFDQSSYEVASIFKDIFKESGIIKKVIHPIYVPQDAGSRNFSKNYENFLKAYNCN